MGETGTTLDEKTELLVRLGALIAVDASRESYSDAIPELFAAGATVDEIIDTLVAVSSTVGLARVVTASQRLMPPLGYDIDAAIEQRDPPGIDR